jgi:hypothetical protein
MLIPGADVFKIALTVINPQGVTYYQASSRALNDVGQYVTTFASGVILKGSFQPVPRSLYETYGLDLQKSYFTFYTSNNIIDLTRDVSADQLDFNSERFQVESNNEWFAIDGWVGVLCVKIKEGS